MTVEEKLEELIDLDSEPSSDSELDEADPEAWQSDMQELVRSHDSQLWFLGAIVRLVKPRVSQFNWLRNIRCQV